MSNYIFEEHYPFQSVYQCPPEDSEQFNGDLYRFSRKNNEISEKDFTTCLNNRFIEKYAEDHKMICQGGAYSSYLTLEDAEFNLTEMKKNSPGIKKKFKGIFKVPINHTDGKIRATPSNRTINHYSWWAVKNKNYTTASTFVKNHN